MGPENFKVIGAVLLVLLVIYMILRSRTEKIRRRRSDHQSRIRRNR